MAEGRKALESSAAARGGLLSGPTLAALQRQGQELGSQEYGQAWNRASQQAQLREGWAQRASEMGYGQAESEARLREQVNQVASQQGWNQATRKPSSVSSRHSLPRSKAGTKRWRVNRINIRKDYNRSNGSRSSRAAMRLICIPACWSKQISLRAGCRTESDGL